jgi:hypothetical protein
MLEPTEDISYASERELLEPVRPIANEAVHKENNQ